jgi:hypothetical protein
MLGKLYDKAQSTNQAAKLGTVCSQGPALALPQLTDVYLWPIMSLYQIFEHERSMCLDMVEIAILAPNFNRGTLPMSK